MQKIVIVQVNVFYRDCLILKEYDLIAVGSGTVAKLIDKLIKKDEKLKAAIIEKDEFGGICLLRGCIPSKLLLHPADFTRMVREGTKLGVDATVNKVNFNRIMNRMRKIVQRRVDTKKETILNNPRIDFYSGTAEFTEQGVLKVGENKIKGKKIFLGLGSEPTIPAIKGLNEIDYHTNKTILKINYLPKNIAFIGGGYIAAEFGHFFSAMGSKVVIFGRNPQFLPEEEPEIAKLALKELRKYMMIYTNHEVVGVKKGKGNKKTIIAKDRTTKKNLQMDFDAIFVAAGRSSNSHLLKPEKGAIEIEKDGWIKTNEFLETSQPNVWSLGDANGKHLFKHVANHEMFVIYNNLTKEKKIAAKYHAVPHAVFTYPKIAGVGMKQDEVVAKYGEENILIGFRKYNETIKGLALGLEESDFFAKIILEKTTMKILGAHIIGPEADILIHELINLMNTNDRSAKIILESMHIHPVLSEIIEQAVIKTKTIEEYNKKHRLVT